MMCAVHHPWEGALRGAMYVAGRCYESNTRGLLWPIKTMTLNTPTYLRSTDLFV